MCDVAHSSHYSLFLFTQLHYSTLQGLRGVAVADSLDYDENYYVPEDYVEDFDLDFEEEPLDLDSFDDEDFDDEDLDSDMELYQGYGRGFGRGRRNRFGRSQRFDPGLKDRAFRQLNRNGRISSRVAGRLNRRQVSRVFRADGINPNRARVTSSGAITVGRRRGGRNNWAPRRRSIRRYYD